MEYLSLRRAEYFVAVAEETHFGRAARRLYIAQPSLSQQVRKLEAQLGVTLFVRTSRGVELTAAGEAFLPAAREVLASSRRAMVMARRAGAEPASLTIGFAGSAGAELIPRVLETFRAEHPRVAVSLRELSFSPHHDLTEGRADAGFVRLQRPETDLNLVELGREPRVLAAPTSSRFAGSSELAMSELGEEGFITLPAAANPAFRQAWLAEQRRHGLPGRVIEDAASVQEILSLVALGRGVALVPQAAAHVYPRPGVAFIPVADADPAALNLAWHPSANTPYLQAFIATVRQQARIAPIPPARSARES